MKKEKWIFKRKYLLFYFRKHFEITYNVCGYFDARPRFVICLGFFHLELILPFENKKWADECDPPTYGIAIHGNMFWIYTGGEGNDDGGNKWITWHLPFFDKIWVRTSVLLKDGSWAHNTPKDRKEFYQDEWKEKQMSWDYDFTDKYDNTMIPTKIYVEEIEWRPKWLTWTSLFAKKRRSIDIHFRKEVGKNKGEWKGDVYNVVIRCVKMKHHQNVLREWRKKELFNYASYL